MHAGDLSQLAELFSLQVQMHPQGVVPPLWLLWVCMGEGCRITEDLRGSSI